MNQKLIKYSMQIAMLQQLKNINLISDKEFLMVKRRIMQEYGILSDLTC